VSTDFPGFAVVVGAACREARVVRDFVVALFGALVVLAATLARRGLPLLADFALADRAALLFATDREGRDVAAAGLRFREALAVAGALRFLATVRDDFLFAFFRAAMADVLQTRGFAAGELNDASDKSLGCQRSSPSNLALRGAKDRAMGPKAPLINPLARNSRRIKSDNASALTRTRPPHFHGRPAWKYSIAFARVARKIRLELTGSAVEILSVGRTVPFNRDVWPNLGVLGVDAQPGV
jgi:hypothetical protein